MSDLMIFMGFWEDCTFSVRVSLHVCESTAVLCQPFYFSTAVLILSHSLLDYFEERSLKDILGEKVVLTFYFVLLLKTH